MKKVIYPGTFDPIHNGHIDIAKMGAKLFDEFVFAVAVNPSKKPLFTEDERIELIKDATSDIQNISVLSTKKLIVDLAKEEHAIALIRGLRHVSDFELEFQMAMMNSHLNPQLRYFCNFPKIFLHKKPELYQCLHMITYVHHALINLSIFNPCQMIFLQNVPFAVLK